MQGENMTCPDQKCQTRQEHLEKCVENLKMQTVRKSTLKWMVGLSVTVILAVSLQGIGASSERTKQDDKAKDERRENTKQIEVIKTDMVHIKKTVEKIDRNQMTPVQLLELMRRAVREESGK